MRNTKGLALATETVRLLTDRELAAPAAAALTNTGLCAQLSLPNELLSCGCTGDDTIGNCPSNGC